MTRPQTYVVMVAEPDGPKNYVTVMPPDAAFSAGLIPEAVVGILKPEWTNGPITPDVFAANSLFRKFLAEVIARHGPQQPGLEAEAKRIGTGHVVLVDQRTPTPEGPVPSEDILGAFRVQDGEVTEYLASPNHRLLAANGFFQLDDGLTQALLGELSARSAANARSKTPE